MDRKARVQAAYVALRDSLNAVGHAWITNRGTTTRGVPRMTIGLEPVWAPVTVDALVRAFAPHGIHMRSTRRLAGIDLRVVHAPTGVALDIAIAPKLTGATKRYLDKLLGRGWQSRPPTRQTS